MINIQFTGKGTGPFRLKMVDYDVFQIHSPKGAFEGRRDAIFMKAESLGIKPEDLPVAVDEMMKKGHNVAEFGIGGGFMFTKKESLNAA